MTSLVIVAVELTRRHAPRHDIPHQVTWGSSTPSGLHYVLYCSDARSRTIAVLRFLRSTVRITVPTVLRRYCSTPYIPAGYFRALSRTCAS